MINQYQSFNCIFFYDIICISFVYDLIIIPTIRCKRIKPKRTPVKLFYSSVHRKINYFYCTLVTVLIFIRLSLKLSFSFFTSTIYYLFLIGPGNLPWLLTDHFFLFFFSFNHDGRTESLLWYRKIDYFYYSFLTVLIFIPFFFKSWRTDWIALMVP